jgi:predicted RNA-binding Zn ribbon-like protein
LLFAPDTEASLEFSAAMSNTVAGASRSGHDELATIDQLAGFLVSNAFSGRVDRTTAEHREVLEMRDRVRAIWRSERDEIVAEINAMLREANALPRLERHDDLDWHLHATDADAPLAVRVGVEIAMALVDVIRSDATDRLRACEAGDCDGLFVDLSRNGSKRFCSIRCGNRMNMVAYRERQAASGERST